MDQTEVQKNIALYYSKLPTELQENFSSMKWMEALERLSAKHSLSETQKQTLGTETMLVLLGMISLEEYEDNLKKDLGLQDPAFVNVMDDIDGMVLGINRDKLAAAFAKNTSPQTPEEKERQEKLDERFAKLSPETQEAIQNANYHAKLYDIAQEHKLKIPQIVDLETATTDVMLGIIDGSGFQKAVKNLGVAPEVADKIIEEVENILKKIRDNLMGKTEGAKPGAPTPMEAPIESREEMLKHLETPELASPAKNPIVSQKLSAPVQSTPVKTEHTLENLSPASSPVGAPEQKSTPPVPPAPKKYEVDPYREKPE